MPSSRPKTAKALGEMPMALYEKKEWACMLAMRAWGARGAGASEAAAKAVSAARRVAGSKELRSGER